MAADSFPSAAAASAPASPRTISTAYGYLVVAVLALVYTFNFMDRAILALLAEPVKRELHLSDTQLGLLSGTAFALFHTVFGIPIANLADRWTARMGEVALFFSTPVLGWTALGAGLASFAGYGLGAFNPRFLMAHQHMTLKELAGP